MKRTDNQRFLAFGQTLRRFLTEHGSLGRGLYEWFREEVGLEDRYIRRWMRGDNLPSPDSWKRFTNALNRRPRSDEPTFAAALSALESALNRARVDEGARIAELSNSITATAESRERLLSLEIPAVGITPSSRHHFSAQRIPFSGRELELARLIAFREDPRPVLWWLIEGPGGSGKSRLALELCNRSQPDWHAGFCPEWQDLSADDLVESRLPHLIVIDYARLRAKATQTFLLRLTGRRRPKARVRVLLLERDHHDSWWEDFRSVGTTRHLLDEMSFAEPMRLEGVEESDLWKHIECACSLDGRPLPQRSDFLEALSTIDPMGRPLLAQLAAEALHLEARQPQWTQRDLLVEVLRREEARFWTPAGVSHADKNLAAFATMVGGTAVSSVLTDPLLAPFIPSFDSFDPAKLAAISGFESTYVLHPVEPDLLGELFVLEHLLPRHGADFRRLRALRDAAMTSRSFALFLVRATLDHKGHPTLALLLEEDTPRSRQILTWVLCAESLREDDLVAALAIHQRMSCLLRAHPDERGLLLPAAYELHGLTTRLRKTDSVTSPARRRSASGLLRSFHELNELTGNGDEHEEAIRQQQALAAADLLNECVKLHAWRHARRILSVLDGCHERFPANADITEMSVIASGLVLLGGSQVRADVIGHAHDGLRALAGRLDQLKFWHTFAEATVSLIEDRREKGVEEIVPLLDELRSLATRYPADTRLAVFASRSARSVGVRLKTPDAVVPILIEIEAMHERWPDQPDIHWAFLSTFTHLTSIVDASDTETRLMLENKLLACLSRHPTSSDVTTAVTTQLVLNTLAHYRLPNNTLSLDDLHGRMAGHDGSSSMSWRLLSIGFEMTAAYVLRDISRLERQYEGIKAMSNADPSEEPVLRTLRVTCGLLLLRHLLVHGSDVSGTYALSHELDTVCRQPGTNAFVRDQFGGFIATLLRRGIGKSGYRWPGQE